MENELNLTWRRVMGIWWGYSWRSTLIFSLIGILLSIIASGLSLIIDAAFAPLQIFLVIFYILFAACCMFFAGAWTMRLTLLKKRQDFRIVLIKP